MATSEYGRMPLIEHLRELRRRIFKSTLAITVGAGAGFYFYHQIIDLLSRPFCDLSSTPSNGQRACGTLTVNGILGPLNLQLKVAILSGIILSAPIWLYQLWAFIAPALHRKERRGTMAFIAAATPFFFGGATLGYITLPTAVKFLHALTPGSIVNFVDFDKYLEFVLRIILIFGFAFELPVFLVTFNFIGFLSGRTILKPWRAWVFAICFFVAAFSPSADPLSMFMLAIPMIAFYLLAGGIALLNDRRRARKSSDAIVDDAPIASSGAIDAAAPID